MIRVLYTILLITTLSCKNEKNVALKNIEDKQKEVSVIEESFGYLPDSTEIKQFTLTNEQGIEMKAITYGGIITSLKTPDRTGKFDDVVLGYDNMEGYLKKTPYFGAIIGRYGNRIANGKFELEGKTYQLATNNGKNHLHGGIKGFDKVVWDVTEIKDENGVGLKLNYVSPDGEEGYPGNLIAQVEYFLGNDNTLSFNYTAKTDRPTIVNLTQHSYFNFTGAQRDVLSHLLKINASNITAIDNGLIPTGEFLSVTGTPFDFRNAKEIGQDIESDDEQMKFGLGFDHNWIIDGDKAFKFAASVYEPKSGRYMEILTTEPGIQFYSGNFLDGSIIGKNNIVYNHRYGFCLETQHFPDSPNKSHFPSSTLDVGETYHSKTTLKFSTK